MMRNFDAYVGVNNVWHFDKNGFCWHAVNGRITNKYCWRWNPAICALEIKTPENEWSDDWWIARVWNCEKAFLATLNDEITTDS